MNLKRACKKWRKKWRKQELRAREQVWVSDILKAQRFEMTFTPKAWESWYKAGPTVRAQTGTHENVYWPTLAPDYEVNPVPFVEYEFGFIAPSYGDDPEDWGPTW